MTLLQSRSNRLLALCMGVPLLLVGCQTIDIPKPGLSSALPSVSAPAVTPSAIPAASGLPAPSATPVATSSPTPMATLSPTLLPSPTATPSATPLPSPTAIPPISPLAFARIQKIAGNGQSGLAENGVRAEVLTFPQTVTGMLCDPAGNIWFLDRSNGRLAYVTAELERPNANQDTIKYRLFWVKYSGLTDPSGMVRTPDGTFYVVESTQHRVVKLVPKGDTFEASTFAGTGQQGFNGDGGKATEAKLNLPLDLALAPNGDLYISDSGNHLIRKVKPDGTIVTVAGQYKLDTTKKDPTDVNEVPTFLPVGATEGDGGLASAASVDAPQYLAVDSQNRLYFTSKSNTIRRINNDGKMERFAGSGIYGYNGDDFRIDLAHFNTPTDLVIGPDQLLYFIDSRNYRIRRVDADNKVKDLIGNGRSAELADSLIDMKTAELDPVTLAFDNSGNLYTYDVAHRIIRQAERIK